MAFDIMSLFQNPAVNRLLQPMMTQGAPNQLIAPTQQPQGAPWEGMRQQTVDPMQTAAMPAQAAPQAAPASAQGGGFMDRYRNFTGSDRGQALGDMFAGWAMGSTPNQSLGMGAQMMMQGRGTRKSKEQQNQTVEWLKKQGMSADEAALVASQPPVLADFLKQRLNPQQPDGFTLGEGQVRYDAQGNVVAQGADKKPSLPAGVQEYEYAKQQGFPGTFQDWEASKKGGMSLQVDPETGMVSFQQGGNIKPLTEGQSKDTVFSTRAKGALPLIDQYGSALTSLGESVAGQVPGVGNYMKSPEYQQAEQAGKEFLQAILRKDTGAAITPQETTEYGTVYLPRPGDSPEVLAQKKTSRTRALEAIEAGMPPQAILNQERAIANTNAPSAPPAPGAVMDGYRFKGGNPADPASWEQVR